MFGGSQPGSPQGGSIKMFIMIPAFFMSSKIDYEDDQIMNLLRMTYYTMQCITFACVWFAKSRLAASQADNKEIYVPVPPAPFSGETQTKYKKTTYAAHEAEQVQQLLSQTLMGVGMISFIHFKMGVKQPLFLQSLMAPVTLYESGVFKKFILGSKERIWGEKFEGEEGIVMAEIAEGEETTQPAVKQSTDNTNKSKKDTFDEKLLNTWDAGKDANIPALIKEITKENVNYQTKEGNWTVLMILCGLPNVKADDIKRVIALGANVLLTDDDGCNALHWASYHNRPKAIEALFAELKSSSIKTQLLNKKSSENSTPLEVARELTNNDVISVLSKLNDEVCDVKDID